MKRFAVAPCQWSSPGSKKTRSPGRITSIAPAAPLREPDAFGHPDRLSARVRVPCGARARSEVDVARAEPRHASDGAATASM